MDPAVIETRHRNESPDKCPKPYCQSTRFVRHEDGWQCLNCMKVIYKDKPIVNLTTKEKTGRHSYHPTREMISRYFYPDK